MAYTTDLTDPQFELLEQVLPQSRTYQNVVSRHLIVNGIFYQLKNGCQWRDLPGDFPNWLTVYFAVPTMETRWNVGKSVGGNGETRA